jgi:plasmid stabilization system protein ParE
MIVRWTVGALADLTSIENYQRRHWPESRATFERRLTAIERRIPEFPQNAPEVTQRSGVRVVAFIDLPYRLFYTPLSPTRSMFWRFGTHRASPCLNEEDARRRFRKGCKN